MFCVWLPSWAPKWAFERTCEESNRVAIRLHRSALDHFTALSMGFIHINKWTNLILQIPNTPIFKSNVFFVWKRVRFRKREMQLSWQDSCRVIALTNVKRNLTGTPQCLSRHLARRRRITNLQNRTTVAAMQARGDGAKRCRWEFLAVHAEECLAAGLCTPAAIFFKKRLMEGSLVQNVDSWHPVVL